MIYLITNQTSLWSSDNYKTCTVEQSLKWLNKQDEIAVDTETEGLDFLQHDILILQIGNEEKQFVIDITTINIQAYKDILESKLCIFQNAKFDLKMLYQQGIVPLKVFDTFLAETILTAGIKFRRRGLDYLAEEYCGITMDKSIRTNIKREGLTDRVIKYSANDVKYLPKIKRKQISKLKEWGLMKTIHLDNKFVVVLAYMEFCGMYLNKDKWEEKCINDDKRLISSRQKLDNFIINTPGFEKYIDRQGDLFDSSEKTIINWNSEKQVLPIIESFGVDTTVKDKATGKYKKSIDKKVLQKDIEKSEFIPLYIDFKEAAKVTSTYGRGWYKYINKNTQRIHSNFTQIMNTGRLSSGQKKVKKRNIPQLPNMQNIPADHTRSCFTPMEGNKLVVSDYSGQETVVLANKSKESNIIKVILEGGDMHSWVASYLFNIPYEDFLKTLQKKENKENFNKYDKKLLKYRQISKSAGFAINYGGQGITIAENIGISKEEGDKIYEVYFKAFPGLKKYFAQQKKLALSNGYIQFNDVSYRKCFIENFDEFKELDQKVNNRKFWNQYDKQNPEHKSLVRKYFGIKGQIERDALNYPIQGTSSDITKLAGIYFFQYIIDNNYFGKIYISDMVHDELVIECKEEIAEEIANKLQECMEKAGDKFCKTVPLKADPFIGDYWNH